MKKLAFPTCILYLLISCTRAGTLPPQEVLKKATDASQQLQSATYNADASYRGQVDLLGGQLDGSMTLGGTMTDAGRQLQFALNANGEKIDSQNQTTNFAVSGDFIIGSENDVYMRLNALTFDPPSQMIPQDLIAHMLNQWWLIPSGSGTTNAVSSITPDPSLLRMQTSVISVTKDHGLTNINRRSAYQYDIAIDGGKMRAYLTDLYKSRGKTPTEAELSMSDLDAKGMIWIDADTFFIHRIVWDITSTNTQNPLRTHMDVSIANHNKPVTITLPPNAAPFPGLSETNVPEQTSSSSSLR